MSSNKIRRILAPIKIEQTTLFKFFPWLRKPKKRKLLVDLDARASISSGKEYSLVIEHDDTIEIRETRCLTCGTRLVKNGHNNRIIILDNGLGKRKFRLHRKRCKRCGEIKPDYSKLALKNRNYHENYKRRARQHYMDGLMPSQIRRVMKIDFGVEVPLSTIVRWINEVEEPLREILKTTPVPSSGYWNYDEIHMLIGGNKAYTLDTVDSVTKFVPVAKISSSMGRDAGRLLFQEARRGKQLSMTGLTKDCTTNLGNLLNTRSFKHIKLQNCLTHVKWIASRHVKAFAGLPVHSKKPLSPQWSWLLKRFYNVIDAKDETDAYVKLEILRYTVGRFEGKKQNHLITGLKHVESWLPKLIAHQEDPNLSATNNLLEGFHKKYKYYPSFKRNMMTTKGAQRVLDYRVFRHNYGKFPGFVRHMQAKYKMYKVIMTELPDHRPMAGHGHYFKSEFRKLDAWYGKYKKLWNEFFAIL